MVEYVRAFIAWLNQTCLNLGLTPNQCDQAIPGFLLAVLGGLFVATARWVWGHRPKGHREVTPLKPVEPVPSPSLALLPEGFFDREAELRFGVELIDNWTTSVLEWWGVPQIGKSRLLEVLRTMHRGTRSQEGKTVYTIAINLSASPYARPPELSVRPRLFEEISRQLSSQSSREIHVETEEDFKRLYDTRLIFFFDNAHAAHPQTLKWLGDTFILECPNVRAVFASRSPVLTSAWNANYQLKKKVVQRELGPFSPEDTRRQIVAGLGHDGTLTQTIFELTAGHPSMADKLVRWMRDKGTTDSATLVQTQTDVASALERITDQCLLLVHFRCFLPEELQCFLPECDTRYEGWPLVDFDALAEELRRWGLARRDGDRKYVLESVVRKPMLRSTLTLRPDDYTRIRRTLSKMYDERAWRFPEILGYCLCEKLYHLTHALQAEAAAGDCHLDMAGALLRTLQEDLARLAPTLKAFQARRLYETLSADLKFQGSIPDIYPFLLQLLEGAMKGGG